MAKCHEARDYTMSLACARFCDWARKNGMDFEGEVVAHHTIRPRVEALLLEGINNEAAITAALKKQLAPVCHNRNAPPITIGRAVPGWLGGEGGKVPSRNYYD